MKIDKSGFTTIPNSTLRDKNLSFNARGLLNFMLSFDDYSEFSLDFFIRETGEKITVIRSAIKELLNNNYLKREKRRDNTGKVVKWEYSVYSIPYKKLDENQSKELLKRSGGCGYLYVVEVDGNYKIGISKNPKQRLGEYTKYAKEPHTIILEYCRDYVNLEETLHQKYAQKNIRGEWFSLSECDLSGISHFLEPYIIT